MPTCCSTDRILGYCARELYMDTGLLFVHDKRARHEREHVSPDITPGKEVIDRAPNEVRVRNSRREIPGLHNTPNFGNFAQDRSAVFFITPERKRRESAGRKGGGPSQIPGGRAVSDCDQGIDSVRSPSSTMITYMWVKTSSMNRFPQVHGNAYSCEGGGARLSSTRILHSGQGKKIVGSVARISIADCTQSIPQTGHFMLLFMIVPS